MGKGINFLFVILLVFVLTACQAPRFVPLTANNCQVRADLVAEALGVEVSVSEAVDFNDPLSEDSGLACQIVADGAGMAVADFWDANQRMQDFFSFDWQDDPAYAADRPTSSTGAYRKWNAICVWEASWQPAPEADCPSDQPIETCALPPEQVLYHFIIQCALDTTQEGQ